MEFYTFEHDPGHGWLGVQINELLELNVAHKISNYSYWDVASETVWLEEDCDLTRFANAKAAKETASDDKDTQHDWLVNVLFERMVSDHYHDDNRIRNLTHFDLVVVQQARNAYIDPEWVAVKEA